ncbi:OPT oligopeptide transporter protein-domain-containing protein [Russula brevipes]|nr:OPT oligopeptide transporter protein-domain-containing protein [Russula brevipes]
MDSALETHPSLPFQNQAAPGVPSEETLAPSEKGFDPPPDSCDTVLAEDRDLVAHIISVDDDPSLNPYTIRSFLIGIGLSQSIIIKTMFLSIIGYLIGISTEAVVPRFGWFRYLNPGPFNKKENAFIVIMANAAANAAMATEIFSVQILFYKINPGCQLLGYGIGGLMRPIVVYPSKMLYPNILPLKLKLFYVAFVAIFVWELFPEWIFPLLTGLSVFYFTRLFGGSNGNEGLGLLSLCFDWQYISAAWNPLTIPLRAQFSILIGYILCVITFLAVYYNNVWGSKDFPFLSQQLFYQNGTIYDQGLILNDKFEVVPTLLEEQGLPYYAGTWQHGLAATFTHLLFWNSDDLCSAWSWMNVSSLKRMWEGFDWRFWRAGGPREVPANADIDPHYREMLKYPDAPNSWYGALLVFSIVLSWVCLQMTNRLFPGGLTWGFILSCLLAAISILFFGSFDDWGFLHPGKPVANMFFVLFSYNSVNQAELLLQDLKTAQYTKLPPRAAFIAQILGTLIYYCNQYNTLLSVEGTNIWSGQQLQQFNSQAIVWGGLSHELFAPGKRYQWVVWAYFLGFLAPIPFWVIHRYNPKLRADYLYTPLILLCMGMLGAGINTSPTIYFAIAWFSQWFLRTRYPKWFARYNYILGAALDGGTQVMVFLLSFAVQGAVRAPYMFPKWWGANHDGNYDRCAVIL